MTPKQCPKCGQYCPQTDMVCMRCRSPLDPGWVRWLPALFSGIFTLLMVAFLIYANTKTRSGRLDNIAAIANNLTNVIFLGAAAALGAFVGWVLAWFMKAATRR
jgi:hypothetical protein